MEWMTLPLKRYAQFSGRSQRKEFWMFFLFVVIVSIIASLIDRVLGFGAVHTVAGPGRFVTTSRSTGPIGGLFALAMLIPGIAVAVRRLHDTDRSGWWLLLSLVPIVGGIIVIVFYCLDGTTGTNRFGPDPKSANLGEVFR